jgi:tRNA threonylcarbamoyladenosine biosynthesis protein TsaE
MGSGKTTLIRALCKTLGVLDNVSSPTFSIINQYEIPSNKNRVYHMDWYRLKNSRDAIEAGVADILEDAHSYCFIEWPEIAEELLPKKCQRIYLAPTSPDTRIVSDVVISKS